MNPLKLNTTIHYLVFALVVGMLGCKDSKQTNQDVHEVIAAGESQISFPRAEEFQNDWSIENSVICHALGDPDDMHPLNGSSAFGRILNLYLHGYLVLPDPSVLDGLGPGLVVSMPEVSADGLVYTYKLRDGITWDDKSELTVEMSYSVTRLLLAHW